MELSDLYKAFKRQVDKSDGFTTASFTDNEIQYWATQALNKFVKTRYTGTNAKQESVEQTQKRADDLRTVTVSTGLSTLTEQVAGTDGLPAHYVYVRPDDYWFTLSEQLTLSYTNNVINNCPGAVKFAGVIEKTMNDYVAEVNNSLSEHRLHQGQARPIRITRDNKVLFITDNNYKVDQYILTYIKDPMFGATDVAAAITAMPQHTHDEIITMSVLLALENISDPRTQTYSGVEQSME